jgi:hypothetical protein
MIILLPFTTFFMALFGGVYGPPRPRQSVEERALCALVDERVQSVN